MVLFVHVLLYHVCELFMLPNISIQYMRMDFVVLFTPL